MMYINTFSAVTSVITLAVTGGFPTALGFCAAHPRFMLDATFLSMGAVGGQFFIYSMVKEFGALAFAACMNVRQVVSIIVSYIAYSKPVTLLQIGGLMIVFGALFYKSFAAAEEKQKEQEKAGESEKDKLLEA